MVDDMAVERDAPKRCAMARLERPSAASKQMRDRSTTLCGVVFSFTEAFKVLRCSVVIGSIGAGFHMLSVKHRQSIIVKTLLRHYTRFRPGLMGADI